MSTVTLSPESENLMEEFLPYSAGKMAGEVTHSNKTISSMTLNTSVAFAELMLFFANRMTLYTPEKQS